jgi:hypothetical protein
VNEQETDHVPNELVQHSILFRGGQVLEKKPANGKTAMREVLTLWKK